MTAFEAPEAHAFPHASRHDLFGSRVRIAIGAMRTVILTKRYAIKLPGKWRWSHWPFAWRTFLRGLLANMQEKQFADERWPQLCPVSFYLPGGLILVMPRARPLTHEEWERFDYKGFVTGGCPYAMENFDGCGGRDWTGEPPGPLAALIAGNAEPSSMLVPAEYKRDSFGVLNGRVVALDYG